jgi:c-di-GMP-binding flagellar brake protein YcgR
MQTMTMDTAPSPLDALAAAHGGLDDFRITKPTEIVAMLRKLQDGNVMLNLNAPNGSAVTAMLWSVDSDRQAISLSVHDEDPQLQAVLDGNEATVVGYLDSVKLQFDLQSLVLVRGAGGCALSCNLPREMFRFQRRSAFRVRPLLRNSPMAQLRHPMIGEMQLSLRILDVSLSGCALFLPNDVPTLDPGVLMNHVHIDLDADTHFTANLRLQHITALNADLGGTRLGCELVNLAHDAERALQRYIDQTQKRRRLMSLD